MQLAIIICLSTGLCNCFFMYLPACSRVSETFELFLTPAKFKVNCMLCQYSMNTNVNSTFSVDHTYAKFINKNSKD